MTRHRSMIFLLALAASPLAGCAPDTAAHDKEVAELRAELQRVQRESDKQREQLAALDRLLNGFGEDLARVNKVAADAAGTTAAVGQAAAGTTNAGAAAADGAVASADPASADPVYPSIRAFFQGEEGKKIVAAGIKAEQDRQEQERTNRMVAGMLARLAKDANLTDDQQQKMSAILGRSSNQMRELWRSMNDATPEDRDQNRQKLADLRTSTDNEVKAVLSQTQFESYQKIVPQGGMGGFGGFGGPGGRGNRGPGGGN